MAQVQGAATVVVAGCMHGAGAGAGSGGGGGGDDDKGGGGKKRRLTAGQQTVRAAHPALVNLNPAALSGTALTLNLKLGQRQTCPKP